MEINTNPNTVDRTNQHEHEIVKSSDGYRGANYLINNGGDIVGFEHAGKKILLASASVATGSELGQTLHNYTKEQVHQIIDDYVYKLMLQERNIAKHSQEFKTPRKKPNIGLVKRLDVNTNSYDPKSHSMSLINNVLINAINLDNQIHGILKNFDDYEPSSLTDEVNAYKNELLKKSQDLQILRDKAKKIIKAGGYISASKIEEMKDTFASIKEGVNQLREMPNIEINISKDALLSDIKDTKNQISELLRFFSRYGKELETAIESEETTIKKKLLDEYNSKTTDLLENIVDILKKANTLPETPDHNSQPNITTLANNLKAVKNVLSELKIKNIKDIKTSLDDILAYFNEASDELNKLFVKSKKLLSQPQSRINKQALQNYNDNVAKEIFNLSNLKSDLTLLINKREQSNGNIDDRVLIPKIREMNNNLEVIEKKLEEFKSHDALLETESSYSDIQRIYKENENRVAPLKTIKSNTPPQMRFTSEHMRDILISAKDMDFRINSLKERYNHYLDLLIKKPANPLAKERYLNKLHTLNLTLEEKLQDLQDITDQSRKVIKNKDDISMPEYLQIKSNMDSIDNTLKRLELEDEDLSLFMKYLSDK